MSILEMAGAKRGRPPKRKRNISGLRNQGNVTCKGQGTHQEPENPQDPEALVSQSDNKLGTGSGTDEGRNNIEEDRVACEDVEDHPAGHLGGLESLEDSLGNEELQQEPSQYAAVIDESIDDEDWVPEEQKRRKKRR